MSEEIRELYNEIRQVGYDLGYKEGFQDGQKSIGMKQSGRKTEGRPKSCNMCKFYFDCRKGSIANAYGGLECAIKYNTRTPDINDAPDDILLQEIQSLREQIKILAHITYTYNPDVDISIYLRHLKTEDYQEFIENNKKEKVDINTEMLEALIDLMKGVEGLPPLTAIQGTLTRQWLDCEDAIKKATSKTWEEIKELFNE